MPTFSESIGYVESKNVRRQKITVSHPLSSRCHCVATDRPKTDGFTDGRPQYLFSVDYTYFHWAKSYIESERSFPNKARRGQKWQNIAYLYGKSPHVNIFKSKYVHCPWRSFWHPLEVPRMPGLIRTTLGSQWTTKMLTNFDAFWHFWPT